MPAEPFRERLPALGDSFSAPELVLLHGWAASSDIWRASLPLLRRHFNVTLIDLPGHGRSRRCDFAGIDPWIDTLLDHLPPRAIYLGWSLGGMLATRLADRAPERISALITIASNARFVACSGWSHAMAPEAFEAFYVQVGGDSSKALNRFCRLEASGDRNEKPLLKQLREVPSPVDLLALQRGLDWLRELDNREALRRLRCPVLHCLGETDALVPAAVAPELDAMGANHRVAVIREAAHLPFVSQPDIFWSDIVAFAGEQGLLSEASEPLIDKRAVASSFSRAANTYDGVADLQRRVADKAVKILPSTNEGITVDLGCGTGYSVPALKATSPRGRVIGIDLAEGMLRYASMQPSRSADAWLCGDGEDLPLADESVDRLFSSLSVQWCENLGAVFAEAYRVLHPGGCFVLSTLGPRTLWELRKAWQSVDGYVHVNQFADEARVRSAVQCGGLQLRGWEESFEILHYGELRELMAELKQLGAHNLNAGRPGGLTGRQRLRRFVEGYEQFRDDRGRLPATYQVWYLLLEK